MSLRARLMLGLLALAAVGLLVADAISYAALALLSLRPHRPAGPDGRAGRGRGLGAPQVIQGGRGRLTIPVPPPPPGGAPGSPPDLPPGIYGASESAGQGGPRDEDLRSAEARAPRQIPVSQLSRFARGLHRAGHRAVELPRRRLLARTGRRHRRGRGLAAGREPDAVAPAPDRRRRDRGGPRGAGGARMAGHTHRPAAARADAGDRERDRRRRPVRAGRDGRRAHRGRPPRGVAQLDAGPDRARLRGTRGERGAPAPVPGRCVPRAPHAAHLDPRLRGGVPARCRPATRTSSRRR